MGLRRLHAEAVSVLIWCLDAVSAFAHSAADALTLSGYSSDYGTSEPDIFVVSFPRSGTTLLQMMLYQLTTDGSMDFDHLNDVSPWPGLAARNRQPLPILPSPQIVKVHEDPRWFRRAKRGRFLLVFRDPADVAVSYHHHRLALAWPGPTLDAVFNSTFRSRRSGYFHFYERWLRAGRHLDVIPISYEAVVADRERAARELSAVLGLNSTEEQIRRAVERTSFAYMKAHEAQLGFRRPLVGQFLRKGVVGEGQAQLSTDQRRVLDANAQSLRGAVSNHLARRRAGEGSV